VEFLGVVEARLLLVCLPPAGDSMQPLTLGGLFELERSLFLLCHCARYAGAWHFMLPGSLPRLRWGAGARGAAHRVCCVQVCVLRQQQHRPVCAYSSCHASAPCHMGARRSVIPAVRVRSSMLARVHTSTQPRVRPLLRMCNRARTHAHSRACSPCRELLFLLLLLLCHFFRLLRLLPRSIHSNRLNLSLGARRMAATSFLAFSARADSSKPVTLECPPVSAEERELAAKPTGAESLFCGDDLEPIVPSQ